MTNATFEPDYLSLSDSHNDENIDWLQNQVDSIRDLLVFDDDTEETIAIVQGGFTHNIIGFTLSSIAERFNDGIAKSILSGFSLENVGW